MNILAFFKQIRLSFVMGLIAFMTVFGGGLMHAQSVFADCDPVNIVKCGLSGSSLSANISSFKSHWNNQTPSDFRTIARWGGWTSSLVTSTSTENTKFGTLYRSGVIKVDGKIVANNTYMSARFGEGRDGFVKITDGVWARKTTTEAKYDTYKVMIRFNDAGKAVAGIVVDCGNIIKFTPVEPPAPPVASLVCNSLTATEGTTKRMYNFVSKATATNTSITSYVFDFGDGSAKQTVSSAQSTANVSHQYADKTAQYTAKVYVNGTNQSNITSDNCAVIIKTTATPILHPSVQIEKTVSKDSVLVNEVFTYKITVTNNGDTDLTNVAVYDKAPAKVTFMSASVGNLTSSSWSTTIASLPKGAHVSFTIKAKATATSDEIVNNACVNAPAVNPSDPKKDDECSDAVIEVTEKVAECKPGVPIDDESCDSAAGDEEDLPDTGAGSVIALVSMAIVLGTIAHYLYTGKHFKIRFGKSYEQ